jgi:hypothetical protein
MNPTYTDTERLDVFIEHSDWFRYASHPTMDGKYPCWICWTPSKGETHYKDLRDALDQVLTDIKEIEEKS